MFRTGKRHLYRTKHHHAEVAKAEKEGDMKNLEEKYAKEDGFDLDGNKLKKETRRRLLRSN